MNHQSSQNFNKNHRPVMQTPTISVTDEPTFLKDHPQEIVQLGSKLSQLIEKQPKQAIKELNQLLAKYPNSPLLMCMLAKAYESTQQKDLYDKIRTENYRHNPNNIFARCGYTQLCIEQERFNEVPPIFNNTFDLTALYPEQIIFSTEETLLFYSTIGFYFILIKQFANAEVCLEVLENIEKDNPATQTMAVMLYMGIMEKINHLVPEEALDDIFSEDDDEDDIDMPF